MRTGPYNRILVARNDRLGDWVLTLPLLDAVHESWPACRITTMARPVIAPLLARHPAVTEIVPSARPTLAGIAATARLLKDRRFDAAVVVHPGFADTAAVWAAGVPVRVGNGYRGYSFLYNRRVYFHRSSSVMHEVEYNLLLLTGLGLPAPSPARWPRLEATAADRAAAAVLLAEAGLDNDDYVVIHPGSGGSSLLWSRERYRTLANELARGTGLALVVTGGPAEVDLGRYVAAGGARRFSAAGRTDFSALVGVIAGARLFISGDTGPMHVAAALGVPVLGLFTPLKAGSPTRWGPRTAAHEVVKPEGMVCDGCRRGECPHYNCMEAVTVEEVYGAARRLLGRGAVNRG